ncbi:MAG TPA: methyltransferase domain-containing protein [Thermoanaerobaculia bacterium]
MKKRLLDWIVCPQCGERPRLQVFREERVEIPSLVSAPACSFYCGRHDLAQPERITPPPDCNSCYQEEILEGALSCASCGLVYPIVGGIPRLIRNASEEYADFFARHNLAPSLSPHPLTPSPVTGRGEKKEAGWGRPSPGDGRGDGGEGPTSDRRSFKSFSQQWTIYQEGDHTWFKDDAGLRKQEFLDNLDVAAEELPGKTMLDGGCGNGELTRSIAEYDLEIVAMDFSRSVEKARERLFSKGFPVSHKVHYIQGNVLELPLLPRSFDLVHTSGVLHHTPSTYRAFRSISKAPKPGGKLYVQLYRRRPTWIHLVNVSLRAVTTRLPMGLLYGLCYAATPLHSALSRLVHFLRREPAPPKATARERAVQMFDNYSPKFQYRHTVPEIVDLFRSEGYENVKDVTLDNEARHMLAVLGTSPSLPSHSTRAGEGGQVEAEKVGNIGSVPA